jgi:hypothetical protein
LMNFKDIDSINLNFHFQKILNTISKIKALKIFHQSLYDR